MSSKNVANVLVDTLVAAGALLGQVGTADPIDATVVLLAHPGDRILTSDPDDLTRLAEAAKCRAVVVAC